MLVEECEEGGEIWVFGEWLGTEGDVAVAVYDYEAGYCEYVVFAKCGVYFMLDVCIN